MLDGLGQLWASGVPVDWNGVPRHGAATRGSACRPTRSSGGATGSVPRPDGAAAEHEARDTAELVPPARVARGPPSAGDDGARSRAARSSCSTRARASAPRWPRAFGPREPEPLAGAARAIAFERAADDGHVLDPADARRLPRSSPRRCATADTRLAGVVDCWSAAPPGDHRPRRRRTCHPARSDAARARAEQPAHGAPAPDAAAWRGAPPRRTLAIRSIRRGRSASARPRCCPQEHPGLRLAHIDVDADAGVVEHVAAELAAGAPEPTVALRDGTRFVEAYDPVAIDSIAPPARSAGAAGRDDHRRHGPHRAPSSPRRCSIRSARGWYSSLARHCPSRATGRRRSEDPAAPGRPARSAAPAGRGCASERDEVAGARGGPERPGPGLIRGRRRDRPVRPYRHASCTAPDASIRRRSPPRPTPVPPWSTAQLSPKLRGLLHLMEAMRGREPSRWVLHSSISSVLGGLGLAAYAGANAVLDALAVAGGERWLSVGWDAWDNAGRGARSRACRPPIRPPEGREAFLRLLGVDVGTAGARGGRATSTAGSMPGSAMPTRAPARPAASSGIHARTWPRRSRSRAPTPSEQLAEIWAAQLGVARGRDTRPVPRPRRPLACSPCRWPRRSGTRSRSSCRCSSCSRRRRWASWRRSWTSSARAPRDEASAGLQDVTAVAEPSTRCSRATAPGVAAKAGYREFYDDVTRRLDALGRRGGVVLPQLRLPRRRRRRRGPIRGAGRRVQPELRPAGLRAHRRYRPARPTGPGRRLRARRHGRPARRAVTEPTRRAWTWRPRRWRSAGGPIASLGRPLRGRRRRAPAVRRPVIRRSHQHRVLAHVSEPACVPGRGAASADRPAAGSSTPTCFQSSGGRRYG